MDRSAERESLVAVCKFLRRINNHSTIIGIMSEVIQIDAKLSQEERFLLQSAFKSRINERRDSIRVITEELARPDFLGGESVTSKLIGMKHKAIQELHNCCTELGALIDIKLMPAAEDPLAKIFYDKLKADSIRYLCEWADPKEKPILIEQATGSYKAALELIESAVPKRHPVSLGLILNYAVFNFEICGKKDEALTLLETTFTECTSPTDEQLEESVTSEVHILLQMMRDNVTLWNRSDINF
jgi:14-3-3 protein epsilon